MLSDQVSHPRRCNGKSAAVLPTLPQATQDWIDSTVGMSVPGWRSMRSNTFFMSRKMIAPLTTKSAIPAECIAPSSQAWAMNKPARPITVKSGITSARFHMSPTSSKSAQPDPLPSSWCFSRKNASAIAAEAQHHAASVVARPGGAAGGKRADDREHTENEDLHPKAEPGPEGALGSLERRRRFGHFTSALIRFGIVTISPCSPLVTGLDLQFRFFLNRMEWSVEQVDGRIKSSHDGF